jgi:hypothetical protein
MLVTGAGVFNHSDKIIRLNNWYKWGNSGKDLFLSNGSMGLINNKKADNYSNRRHFVYYFTDKDKPLNYIDSSENFELAYAITIHKSQGSDFKNVFLVVPRKSSLLSKELLYTALTRSTHRVYLFLETVGGGNPLEKAKNRSDILARNTSIFETPTDSRRIYVPEAGVEVKSKVEYIIYSALKEARDAKRLEFEYEEELPLHNAEYSIHPDFTLHIADKTYYWEHLGILDAKDYYDKWVRRRKNYEEMGLLNNLVTTDDLYGIKEENIKGIIDKLLSGKLAPSIDTRFSKYHYSLN